MNGAFQILRSHHVTLWLSGGLEHGRHGVAHQARIFVLGRPVSGKAQGEETINAATRTSITRRRTHFISSLTSAALSPSRAGKGRDQAGYVFMSLFLGLPRQFPEMWQRVHIALFRSLMLEPLKSGPWGLTPRPAWAE